MGIFSTVTLGCCMDAAAAAAGVANGFGVVGGWNIKKMLRNVCENDQKKIGYCIF